MDTLNKELMRSILQKEKEKEEVVGMDSYLLIQTSSTSGTQGRGTHWSEKALSDMTARDWRIMREDFEIRVQGARTVNPLRFWSEAALHPSILEAVQALGYTTPSPIQRQAIPLELKGYDVIGIAKTGS